MILDVTVTIGGQAGQGIQTVGSLMARACHAARLFLFAINDYESRVRGGHSFMQLRISSVPVRASRRHVHLLAAMDESTVEIHEHRLSSDGLIITDEQIRTSGDRIVGVPVSELAAKAGGRIMANTVIAGVCLAVLGFEKELVMQVVREEFANRDEKVREQNLSAADVGYEAGRQISFSRKVSGAKPGFGAGMLQDGAKALAWGAVAGDCRFAAFYPMSPATGIMNHLSSLSEKFPLKVVQVEDEIAAANMIVGASYAGVRAVTSTSGGGFCLMTEALGLAAISETPMVIINAMRPGPATGLPTRTGQGDLLFSIHASQDEFPRFVFAPDSPEEAYLVMIRALDLSDRFQVPAIVLADHHLVDALCTVTDKPVVPRDNPRHVEKDPPLPYSRYALTETGISPRALPCRGEALVGASGNEHGEDGHISERIYDRNSMVEKRNAKMMQMEQAMHPPRTESGDCRMLLVGWGSTGGVIAEAARVLRDQGHSVGAVQFVDIWPFPEMAAKKALGHCEEILVVEQNSTGQFARLLLAETGLKPAGRIAKFNGRPFCVEDIVTGVLDYL